MALKLWQVDAFAAEPLEGNPAAIVPLERWLDDRLMQKIAGENNLSETAFFVQTAPGKYDLRWFTPATEVDLCGHATFASAWAIFECLAPELNRIDFETRSGTLTVTRGDGGLHVMSLPADTPTAFAAPQALLNAIGDALRVAPPREVHLGRYAMAVWDEARTIGDIRLTDSIDPVLRSMQHWGLIATAPGDVTDSGNRDFVSRFFSIDHGIPEDPVTGSAHCLLTPFWARRLGKTTLKARQVSARGGDLLCTHDGARTILSGPCSLYMSGEIFV